MMNPILMTDRMVLRRPRPDDWPSVRDYMTSPRAADIGVAPNERDGWLFFTSVLGHWEIHGFGLFSLLLRTDHRPIGFAGPWYPATWDRPELALHLFHEADEGSGYAQEAAHAVIEHFFETQPFDSMYAYASPANTGFARLIERLGGHQSDSVPPVNDPSRDRRTGFILQRPQ